MLIFKDCGLNYRYFGESYAMYFFGCSVYAPGRFEKKHKNEGSTKHFFGWRLNNNQQYFCK